MKLLSPVLAEPYPGHVAFGCPGCRESHVVRIAENGTGNPPWGYNGNPEKPTFTPSVLVTGLRCKTDEDWRWTGEYHRDAAGEALPARCHTFVTDGKIHFLSDCHHELAGQTVDLPPYPVKEHG